MSSSDQLPEVVLRRKTLWGQAFYGVAVAAISIPLFCYLIKSHHESIFEHPLEAVLVPSATFLLLTLIGAGIWWANRLSMQYSNTLAQIRQLADDIAHDLRTPLTRLSAAAEMTAVGDLPAEELAGTVGTETQQCLHLINTMLDISKVERGLVRGTDETFDPLAATESVVELYRPILDANGIALTLDLQPCPCLAGLEIRFRQMLQNLLDNASKFTPRGGDVAIGIRPLAKGVELTVKDTGPGIPDVDKPHIFDRFYRGDTTRTKPGNGLGLALVKAIVTSFGGTIACTDRYYGYGTVFTIILKSTPA